MKKSIIILLSFMNLLACGQNNQQTADQGDQLIDQQEVQTIDPNIDIEALKNKAAPAKSYTDRGYFYLTKKDVMLSSKYFCAGLAQYKTNSELAFGCFFTKTLLVPTTHVAKALLSSIDEPIFDMQKSYFGVNGLLVNFDKVKIAPNKTFPQFNYSDFDLPLAKLIKDVPLESNFENKAKSILRILISRVNNNNINAQQIKDMVAALNKQFVVLEPILQVAANDNNLAFKAPAAFFNQADPIIFKHQDAALLLGTLQASIMAMDFINAYDFGVNLKQIQNLQTNDILEEVLVADLNGTGETINNTTVDNKIFLTLINKDKITANLGRYNSALSFLKEGMNLYLQGNHSQMTDKLFGNKNLSDINKLFNDLSVVKANNFQDIVIPNKPNNITFKLNVDAFFKNPPSAANMAITAGDPFVYNEEPNNVKMVKTYFKKFLEGIVIF